MVVMSAAMVMGVVMVVMMGIRAMGVGTGRLLAGHIHALLM
ncbi:hypothetical protein AA15669_0798 [Saccharibacter floricola DSM 15669]|uniref:Uncharacterized protein n=1 Tax=Saccharibacter floricola DSM 15669 TaxID=1123227 RepID=A0ABQ0NXW2_9PROT|nr:hypothetical protein AA15669_0798 [Saccharibacter floricola DSM 15669]